MNALVSVIMPSYNTAKYIEQSIYSVIEQTYKDWELIIVDDCSNDDTDEIVIPLLQDSRIKYIKNEKNQGAAMSRNRALAEATGKWVAFLDSDDIWLPDKLTKQIEFMTTHGYVFSYTNYSEMSADGEDNGIFVTGPRRITKRGFYNYCWPGCLTVMYNREDIGLIQIADIKKNNDYAMWFQVSKKADCYLLKENLARYRRGRSGSISSHGLSTMMKWHYRLFRDAQGQSMIIAGISTIRNMFFGAVKKILYVRRL